MFNTPILSSIIRHMKVYYKPHINLGTYSVWLFIALCLFFIIFYFFIVSGQRGGNTFFSNLLLAIPILIAATLAVFSFVTQITGIINRKRRAVFVFISTVVGFLVLLFGLFEIIIPH